VSFTCRLEFLTQLGSQVFKLESFLRIFVIKVFNSCYKTN
jgi:hypothetical protein